MFSITRADFVVQHRFIIIDFINVPPRNDFVSTNSRPYTGPQRPEEGSSEKYTDTNDGENEVRIPFRNYTPLSGMKGQNGQEGIGNEVEQIDGKEGVPRGRPIFAFFVLEMNETSSNGAIDPRPRVGIGIDDKVVGHACGRCYKDNDGHDQAGVLKVLTEAQKQQKWRRPSLPSSRLHGRV
jgi:hypothetical protein